MSAPNPPASVQPPASLSGASRPSASQPAPSQPAPSQPAPSQPSASQPAPSQPSASQPAPSQPSASQPYASQPADDDGVVLTWLGQAGLVVTSGATRLIIDPFIADFPGRAVPPPDPDTIPITAVDAILCTHEHDDHLHPDSLELIRHYSPGAVIVVPAPLRDAVAARLGGQVVGALIDQPINIGDARISPIAAWHAINTTDPVGDGSDGANPARFLGYILDIGGEVVYHSGDTIRTPRHAATLRAAGVTIACLPINGRDAAREALNIVGNLTAAEAVELAHQGGASVLIPIHWDMFAANLGDVTEAERAVAGTELRLVELARYLPTPVSAAN